MTFDPTVTWGTVFTVVNFVVLLGGAWVALKVFQTRVDLVLLQQREVMSRLELAQREYEHRTAKIIEKLETAHREHAEHDESLFEAISGRLLEIAKSVERLIGADGERRRTERHNDR